MRGSRFAVAVLLVCAPAAPVWAQGKRVAPSRKASERAARPQNPVRQLERFEKMSPQQREEELAKLPPERRQQLERRMERLLAARVESAAGGFGRPGDLVSSWGQAFSLQPAFEPASPR